MARIVSAREKKQIADTAFIASLSRFINGKDSAFPGWLLHESERLLPFSEALGLESTRKIWDILWQVTGEQSTEVEVNHPAFPDIALDIAPTFQISLTQIIEQLRPETKLIIAGRTSTGKGFAARWLKRELAPMLSFTPQIIVMPVKPDIQDDCLTLWVSSWGVRDVQSIITQLLSSQKISTSGALHLRQFSEILDEKWLDFDRRPDRILWLLFDISQHGIPENYGEGLRRHNRRSWRRIQAEKEVLSRVSLETWQSILHTVWQEGFSLDKDLFLKHLQSHQPSSFGLSRENLAVQIKKLRSRAKGAREEALLFLERQVQQIDSAELFEALMQVGLIEEQNERITIIDFQYQLPFLAEYLSQQEKPTLPESSYLCSQDWWRLLWMLCVLDFSHSQLKSVLRWHPQWAQIDCARSILFWIYFSAKRVAREQIIQPWSICVWAELQSIFPIKIPFFQRFSDLIVEISFQQAEILPPRCELSMLEEMIGEDISVFPRREFIQYRDLVTLIPVQQAPKTIGEWSDWSDAHLAWSVLERRARMGDADAIRLLSEGEGKNDPIWQGVPFATRLYWLGVEESTSQTLYAFQLLLIEAWDPSSEQKDIFLQTAERIGFSEVLEWMRQWCSPLFIGQYLHAEKDITATLSQATIDFCMHFQAHSLLESWLDQVWNWGLSADQIKGNFISWQNTRVFVSNIASHRKQLFQKLAALIFNGAKKLYHQERPYLLYRLYFEGQQFETQAEAGWIKKDAHQFLLQEGDITLIQEWIDSAPASDPLMERYLLQDVQKLSKAWRQDKKVMRRQEILRIAALQKPIPRWALSVANKQITREAVWPHWLSPYGSDVVFLIRQMILMASGRNKLWWLRVLHRSDPWPPELVQGIQDWSGDDMALEWTSRTVHALSAKSTPWLDASDMLSLLKDYLLTKEQEELEWLQDAAENLWKNCHPHIEKRAVRQLFSFFETLSTVDFLFQGDWITDKERLLDFLCPMWFARAQIEAVEEHLFHPIIGERVEAYLKAQGNEKAIQQSVRIFLQGKVDRLSDIVRLENVDALLTQFVLQYPAQRNQLAQELRRIPFVWKEETGRLQAWLRQLEF